MRFLRVTTTDDTVADDGVLSLREALAVTADGTRTTVKFARNLSEGFGTGAQIVLETTLEIASGSKVTIDGRLGLIDRIVIDGGFRGNPFDGENHRIMTVAAGAEITLRDFEFRNGFEHGVSGQDATPGTHGLDGLDGEDQGFGGGIPGSNGNGGSGALNDATGAPKQVAVGGIANAGALTLDGVAFVSMNAFGGHGGLGGRGDGGDGGSGSDAEIDDEGEFFGPGGAPGPVVTAAMAATQVRAIPPFLAASAVMAAMVARPAATAGTQPHSFAPPVR